LRRRQCFPLKAHGGFRIAAQALDFAEAAEQGRISRGIRIVLLLNLADFVQLGFGKVQAALQRVHRRKVAQREACTLVVMAELLAEYRDRLGLGLL
jgi:hypothetical protein